MTIQLTVRLPDPLVAYIDTAVANGTYASRTSALAHAIELLQRKADDDREVELLIQRKRAREAGTPATEGDLDGFVAYASSQPTPWLD